MSQKRILEGISTELSVLAYADQLQRRAAEHAFDWPAIEPVFSKMQEELEELKEAIEHPTAQTEAGKRHIIEELGDVLFCGVNLARYLNIDPEEALQATNDKFEMRFCYIEEKMAEQGRPMKGASLDELNKYWNEAKSV